MISINKKVFIIITIIILLVVIIRVALHISNKVSNNQSTNNSNDEIDYSSFPYTLSINNKKYSFPMTYEQFTKLGWNTINDTDILQISNEELGQMDVQAHELTWGISSIFYIAGAFQNENIVGIKPYFYNKNSEKSSIKECEIVGIGSVDSEKTNIGQNLIQISNGTDTISIGSSNYNEIITKFGKPMSETDDNGIITLLYCKTENVTEHDGFLKIDIDKNSNISKGFLFTLRQ